MREFCIGFVFCVGVWNVARFAGQALGYIVDNSGEWKQRLRAWLALGRVLKQ